MTSAQRREDDNNNDDDRWTLMGGHEQFHPKVMTSAFPPTADFASGLAAFILPSLHHPPTHRPISNMSAVAGPSTKPIQPSYCGVCSLPTEYCEFGPSFSKCKSWLEEKRPEEYARLWGEGELAHSPALKQPDIQAL